MQFSPSPPLGAYLAHVFAQLTRPHVAQIEPALLALAGGKGPITLDLSATEAIDGVGVALLARLARAARAQARPLHVVGAQPPIARTLGLFADRAGVADAPVPKPRAMEALGGWLEQAFDAAAAFVRLGTHLSAQAAVACVRPPPQLLTKVAQQMMAMGVDAVGVVAGIALLVGVTVALQSAAQLRQFGAGLLVADLIGVAITRELGPLVAAIIVAGRSGSALAAEIGTMVITEEIDALRVMGLHPVRFLLVPRLWAMMMTQPLLNLIANGVGILGGLAVATLYLDIAPQAFFGRLQEALEVRDLATGIVKSIVFAWLIVVIGALCGLRTRGGPDAVGRSTTSSVVAAIFAIVVADAAASLLFYFGT